MPELIQHIVRISARRDRTEANAALVDAIHAFFSPKQLTIYRCYYGRESIAFACAGLENNTPYCRNAYVPDPAFCKSIASDVVLQHCLSNQKGTKITEGAITRMVLPIVRHKEVFYLIDVTIEAVLSAAQNELLLGLVIYFANHLALIDYGETDMLTGLPLRKVFEKNLFDLIGGNAENLRIEANPEITPWLAICNVDSFQNVNNAFGQLIGDEVLIMLARCLRENFHFADYLFRYEGDAFAVLLRPTDAETAHHTLESFRAIVEAHSFSRVGQITISIGYSRLLPTDHPTGLINRAVEALRYAKQHGRNQVACHENLATTNEILEKDFTYGDIELF